MALKGWEFKERKANGSNTKFYSGLERELCFYPLNLGEILLEEQN